MYGSSLPLAWGFFFFFLFKEMYKFSAYLNLWDNRLHEWREKSETGFQILQEAYDVGTISLPPVSNYKSEVDLKEK